MKRRYTVLTVTELDKYQRLFDKQEGIVYPKVKSGMRWFEPMDRGNALNSLIDGTAGIGELPKGTGVYAKSPEGGRYFKFPASMVTAVNGYVAGAERQKPLRAWLATREGWVWLYGRPDYILGDTVIDLKMCSQYDWRWYERAWQRHAYPYLLWMNGVRTRKFEYLIIINAPFGGWDTKHHAGDVDFNTSRSMLARHCERIIAYRRTVVRPYGEVGNMPEERGSDTPQTGTR